MKCFTLPIFVKLFLFIATFSFVSCASEMFESEKQEVKCRISTAINIEQVKTSDDQSISRGAERAPEMRNFKVEGTKGEMYMRYTAAAGIYGKNISEIEPSHDSRGKMITTADFYDDYGFFAYEYPSTQIWTSVNATATPTIVNERVLKSTGWKTNEFWPGAGSRLALYGYAPYNATGVTNLPTASTVGKPKFRYTVPTEAVDQNDLLVSEDDLFADITNENGGVDVRGDYNAIKTLKFKHACTAVRIAVGERMAPCTITKIAIKGVYGEADYNYGAGSGLNQGAWENYNSTLCDYELNADFTVAATDQNKIINNGKYTFMLLPQTVPDGATIEITLNDGQEHVIKAKISGSEWKMGYSVTYFLTTASVDYSYVLTVSSPGNQISGSGGNSTISVQSYKQTFYGSQVAVPWIASYSIGDDPTKYTSVGSIVKNYTMSGDGSSISESYSINFGETTPLSDPTTNTHTAELRSRTVVSNVNLAAGGETANCYVVTAPGTYTFPLVWGNAIKNGVSNPSAYTSSNNTTPFVDYKGIPITTSGPHIYDSYTPYDAVIVWQDAPNLVTPSSVKLSDDKRNIEFEVNKDNICQGNCVIAVRDESKTIMWSWHIWVTDYDWEDVTGVSSGIGMFDVMTIPAIGYCDMETRKSPVYNVYFHVTQTESGKNASTSYEIGANTKAYGCNAPYFQFGRKDPFIASTGLANEEKTIESYYYSTSNSINTTDVTPTIIYPYCYNTGNGINSNELWNVGNVSTSVSSNSVIKSIFDPCPISFHVPCSGAFAGWDTGSRSVWNGTKGKEGRYFKCYDTGSETIFFLAQGERDGAASLNVVGVYANYWEAEPSSYEKAWSIFFNNGGIETSGTNPRNRGMAIRPVK